MNTTICLRVFLLLTVLAGLTACPQENDMASPATEHGVAVSVADGRALVLFTSGDVTVRGQADWTPIKAGAHVNTDQSVRTGAKSSCELQFGNTAALRLEADTEVNLARVMLAAAGKQIDMSVAAGSVIAKVEKLSGADRFRVKTKTAICGVRGTEFAVTVAAGGATVLSVREGRVSVAPAVLDPDNLPDELSGGDEEFQAAVAALTGAERLVNAAQTVTVTAANLAAAEKVMQTVRAAAGDGERFPAVAAKARIDLLKNTPAPRAQGADQKKLLERVEGMKKRIIRNMPVQTDAGEQSAPELSYYAVGIIAQPDDAEIFLGEEYLGVGRFDGLFAEGVTLRFSVRKPGWAPGQLAVTPGANSAKTYEVAVKEPGAFTETYIRPRVAGRLETRTTAGDVIDVSLGKQRTVLESGALGLSFFPNSAVSVAGRNPYRLLMSVWDDSFLVEGTDLLNLSRRQQILSRGGKGSIDNGRISVSGVYAHTDGRLYAFYYAWDYQGFENEPRVATEPGNIYYSRIGVAVSSDGGTTWKKLGAVLESVHPKLYRAYDGQTTRGVSEACVVPDKTGRYLYLYYTEYSRSDLDKSVGRAVDICLARADLQAGPPIPGMFKKFRNGAFSEDGLGGADSPVYSARDMDGADASSPSVFYSKTLGQYVMVFIIDFWWEFVQNKGLDKCGIYLSYSADGIQWSTPSRLIKDFPVSLPRRSVSCTPAVILDAGSDRAGWLVFAYSPKFGGEEEGLTPTYLAGRRITFRKK